MQLQTTKVRAEPPGAEVVVHRAMAPPCPGNGLWGPVLATAVAPERQGRDVCSTALVLGVHMP